ncbi:hypothetical protein PM082_010164 [Marasmius tenuissimus]|nr:hypothetical protein PM082_010164 [Marasmius tenuissimus]
MNSILVDETNDIRLSYYDSGPPETTEIPYTTIFAVHGWMFSGAVFKKLLPLCNAANIRFVAINRRGYPGSTALSDADIAAFNNDPSNPLSDAEKEQKKLDFLKARGSEFLAFVDVFIRQNQLPPISAVDGDSKKLRGGIAFLGWSLGHSVTFPALANLEHEPKEVQARMAEYLRLHILLEPAAVTIGCKPVPGTWVPTRDSPSMAPASAMNLFVLMVTAYFNHPAPNAVSLDPGNQTRDSLQLEHVAPAYPAPVPSIYNMTSGDVEEIVSLPPRPLPMADILMTRTAPLWLDVLRVNYQKACFGDVVRRELVPRMKVVEIVGDRSAAIVISAFWQVWDDNEGEKGKQRVIDGEGREFVEFRVMKGVNHFMHWDFPKETVDLLKDILDG